MSMSSPRLKLAEKSVRDGFIAIGVALTSFGLNGDIKVEPLTDFAARFEPGQAIWLGGRKRQVQRSRWQGRMVYVKLSGIASADAVAKLRGQYLEVPEAERIQLDPEQYYRSDIIGLAVATADGRDLGRVIEFLPTGANDVLVVRGDAGEVLVPMIEDVVKQIDLAAGRLIIEPLEGLLPEPRPSPRPTRVPTRGPAWRRRLAERASAGRQQSPPSDKPG
jgi:16S rRNA processing protein RimM